jgi:predicted TIM-barrel fold metal-dependent hydrolase
MSGATISPSETASRTSRWPVVDACVYHDWAHGALLPYLEGGWRDLLEDSSPLVPGPQRDPRADNTARAQVGGVGFDYETVRERHLDISEAARFVLGYDHGLLATIHPHHYIARALVKAANDWTTEEWLARDDRLYGLVLVSTAMPGSAAEEIRRVGQNDRFVGIALGGNGLSKPFGHPIYHPIYEAATELELPIVLQVGPETSYDESVEYMGGGAAATFTEWRANIWQTHAVHVTSMIAQGVFQLYPTLKVLLLGSGGLWMPGHLGRLDYWARMMPRDATWLDNLPSGYFAEHFRLATYRLEVPPDGQVERFQRALRTLPSGQDVLIYASGFGAVDAEPMERWRSLLPAEWQDSVLRSNANTSFFRWPASERSLGVSTGEPSKEV